MSNYDMSEGIHRTFNSHKTITEHLKKFNNDHFV